jgi:hypothetical protein
MRLATRVHYVLDGISIQELSQQIVRWDSLDLRDTGVIAIAVSVCEGL